MTSVDPSVVFTRFCSLFEHRLYRYKDAADVFALMSADGSGATCPTCMVPVIEIAAALLPKEENTADFQEELVDVIQLLKKVEDMDVPEYVYLHISAALKRSRPPGVVCPPIAHPHTLHCFCSLLCLCG
jgi:hypothetical protein